MKGKFGNKGRNHVVYDMPNYKESYLHYLMLHYTIPRLIVNLTVFVGTQARLLRRTFCYAQNARG